MITRPQEKCKKKRTPIFALSRYFCPFRPNGRGVPTGAEDGGRRDLRNL